MSRDFDLAVIYQTPVCCQLLLLVQYFVRLSKNETTRNLFILRKLFEEPNLLYEVTVNESWIFRKNRHSL
jgi:hypothetical protein